MRSDHLLIRIADILENLDDFGGSDAAESLSRRHLVTIEIPENVARALMEHPDRAVAVIVPMIQSALDKRDEDSDSSS